MEELQMGTPFMDKIISAILKEGGCFVTSRMLCRRYSNLFKVQNVVAAMKLITTSFDDEHHIGIFKAVKERTKVFYKCPPHLIKPSVLVKYGYSWEDYSHNFYKVPRVGKDQKNATFENFISLILENSPYGLLKLDDLSSSQDGELQNREESSMDPSCMMELQLAVLRSEGCFTSSRNILRQVRSTFRVAHVLQAMGSMTHSKSHHLHIGTFVRTSERTKLFYKCPPSMVTADALAVYGMTADEYRHFFYRNPRSERSSDRGWQQWVLNAVNHYPYELELFPFSSMGVSLEFEEDVKRKQSEKREHVTEDSVSVTEESVEEGMLPSVEIKQEAPDDNEVTVKPFHFQPSSLQGPYIDCKDSPTVAEEVDVETTHFNISTESSSNQMLAEVNSPKQSELEREQALQRAAEALKQTRTSGLE